MKIWNADGSRSELSGNGLRCLGALVAHNQRIAAGASLTVDTDAGVKTLECLPATASAIRFARPWGYPRIFGRSRFRSAASRSGHLSCAWAIRSASCLVRCPIPSVSIVSGPPWRPIRCFPQAPTSNSRSRGARPRKDPDWERGVGPTSSSGTGTSASAVAAAAHGGAAREVDVIAPGGTQRVEWRQDGVYLTGWAELVLTGEWLRGFDTAGR